MIVTAVDSWISENAECFVPPVCMKLMHNDQLKVFFVDGPNVRDDYHLEEGEEMFYMLKGNMCLKVVEHGQMRDIVIKEGEVFLLPGKIPHSPQRERNTMGMVIERERVVNQELDALRYYVKGTTNILFERWFYCKDLGTQLGPVIREFFASEEYKTGQPSSGSIVANPPYMPDQNRSLESPFSLKDWIEENSKEITQNGRKLLFPGKYQSKIYVHGMESEIINENYETFLWQLKNSSRVEIDSKCHDLDEGNCILLPLKSRCKLTNTHGFTLSVAMPPPPSPRPIQ